MPRTKPIANRLATAVTRFMQGESGLGVLLVLAALAAMALANSDLADSYHHWFHAPLPWTPIARLSNLHLWINDGLMAVFFFVIGLELKREVLDGNLSSAKRRRLPVIAAIAGMAVPAAVFFVIVGSDPALQRGWAIPAATDIAFALGVLAIVGRGLPPSLRLFLLSVAIVDDLGAIAVIAVFYTAQLKLVWLGAAALVFAALCLLNRLGIERGLAFVVLALALWYCVLHSGVHATIAGVLAATTVPLKVGRRTGDSMLLRLEHALVPLNGYLIVPLFGFANAGVPLAALGTLGLAQPLPLAIAAGLALGKQIGILGAIAIASRLGIASRPKDATWPQLWGIAALCGIGFTMSLFIAALAFPNAPQLYDEARIGVLGGTLVSALLGAAILWTARMRARQAG